MYNELLHTAIKASFIAGEEILKVYNEPFTVDYKADASPVTEADKKAGAVIEQLLESTGIPVLGEEGEHFPYTKRKDWKQLWIVDPLDGTKEFVKRNGEFTVNIALCENKQPVIGVIYSPVFKNLYFAAKGLGSFKVNSHDVISIQQHSINTDLSVFLDIAKRLPIHTQQRAYTIVASRSHLSSDLYNYIEQLKKAKGNVECINTGSSIKMCLVAEGIADEYPRFGKTMEWDTCAGQCIVEQAGGSMIDCETNEPIRYNREELENCWFIAKGTI